MTSGTRTTHGCACVPLRALGSLGTSVRTWNESLGPGSYERASTGFVLQHARITVTSCVPASSSPDVRPSARLSALAPAPHRLLCAPVSCWKLSRHHAPKW